MKGHLGAVLTSGLAAVALALAVLQAVVLFHAAPRPHSEDPSSRVQSNRYSAPGGRSAVPYLPFDKRAPSLPATPEGRTPEKQQEERRDPPPPRHRNLPGQPGPRAPRRAMA